MKKLSIILLVLILAGGFAFAADIAVTGSAAVDVVYDLDAETFGLVNTPYVADISFALNLASGSGSGSGSGDVYAEIGIDAGIDAYIDGFDADASGVIDGTETADNEINAWASVTYANIIAGDWTVGILGSSAGFDNAVSYFDDDADGVADQDSVVPAFGAGTGVTISYLDYVIGADYAADGTYAVSAVAAMDLADGVSGSVGFAYDGAFSATGTAAVAIGDGALDLAVDFAGTDVEVSAAIDYAPAVLSVYYGADLNAKVALDLAPIALSVDVRDILTAQDINVSASTTVDAAAISVGGGFVVDTSAWDVSGSVAYTMDDAVLTLGGGYTSASVLNLYASVVSTTVIDGATVTLAYAGDDLTGAELLSLTDLGTITAGVSIAL
ncbi:MAG: hypothetical protein HQ557_07515 [Bacteroidetes bacterium]|nr:hypothetical protein [Bacteroidota bacterium]